MAKASFRRKTVLLLLLALLSAPWASAAGRPATQSGPVAVVASAPLDLFTTAWRFLTNLWEKEGCHIDPNGRCIPQSAPPLRPLRPSEGCHIEPSGACQPLVAPATDTGCRIVPSGFCRG